MLLIFDLDGTLIDTKEEIFETFNQAFNNLGLKLDRDKLDKYVGLPLEELLEALLGRYDKRVEEEIRSIYYSERPRKIRVFPGMEEIIKSNGFKKAILTSKRKRAAFYDLSYLGIQDYFHIVIGADDLNRKKPDGEGIKKIMSLADCVDVEKVYMIGDTEMDILAAKNAGVKSVAVTWGFRDEDFLKNYEPDYIMHTPQELKRFIYQAQR
jgi:HAD superfamily hydrolase (TIGR01549 family)